MASIRAFSRNLPYLRQQFSALLGNTSASVKFICIVVIFGYLLSFSEEAVKVLSVTPGYVLPPAFWVWTTFTFCFLELHFWEVLVDIITVGLCGKLIEPLWGQMEMMMFFAIINIGVAILTSFYYLFLYMCTANTDLLFIVHIHGLAGYIAAVSVAVKQIMPEHLLAHTPLGKITNRNIPLSVLVLSLILWILGLLEGTYPAMFCSGLLVSWIYLRFFQRHSNGSRGDAADSFCFASFFPNVLQPPISLVATSIYKIFIKIGLCKPRVQSGIPQTTSGIHISLPGVDPQDMERRRQIALKALNERLSKSDSNRLFLPKTLPLSTVNKQTNPNTRSTRHNVEFKPQPITNNMSSSSTTVSVPTTTDADILSNRDLIEQESSHTVINVDKQNLL